MRNFENFIFSLFTLLIMAAVASGGCTKRINEDLREFVASQPHDEQLFGWWKRLKDDGYYTCFHFAFKRFSLAD